MEKKILVVGDWVVDQHWVTGVHRSPISSRTGQAHYRSLQKPDGTTDSLCAAGQVATVLHRAADKDGNSLFEVIGAGIWHEDDTDELAAMVNPSNLKGQTPHRVTRVARQKPDKVSLFNLGEIVDDLHGTTKVIRIYQHTGARINLIQRIDWEQRLPPGKSEWINEADLQKKSKLKTYLEKNKVDAVVIKDNHKGVVSKALIKWLVETVKKSPEDPSEVQWFISTKTWKPEWFSALRDCNIRLLLIPQITARRSILNGELNYWITNSGQASKKALEVLEDINKGFTNNPKIVVLPKGLSVFACDFSMDNRVGFLQTVDRPRPTSLAVGVPMASVFFPTVISHLLTGNEQTPFLDILRDSLHFTEEWMAFEERLIKDPENWTPDSKPVFKAGLDYQTAGKWNTLKWESEKNKWENAFSHYGIIEEDKKKYIELWRSMTEVEGYICCVKSKRTVLQKLVHEFNSIEGRGARQSKSCILIASPGSGKTFLVKCLARSLRLRYLPFNITQMLSKNDILDCFDTIVTTQAQSPDEMLLVFFDEINAKLEGQHVYDVFLAPLEEGVYVRAGKTFHIDPCVWIFAGTERPKEADEKSIKGSDFEDRLTIRDPLNLKIMDPESDESRVERVYLGVSLLQATFPDVRVVSEKVLRVFHLLSGDAGVRRIKHLVKSCTNIQYGEVLGTNFDPSVLREYKIDVTAWTQEAEGDLVEIISKVS